MILMIKYILLVITLLSTSLFGDKFLVQKPKIYQGYEKIKGWYMSEKLDGIRAYWDGKRLLTKNANIINAPAWFIEALPPSPLDGELWTKRGDFENIQSIVLDDKPSKEWRDISYYIFEAPKQDGNFSQRLLYAKKWADKIDHVEIVEQIRCRDKRHLEEFLKKIESLGGEGVIIKDPTLPYFSGRSSNILKVKSFKDMEGLVIGINEGRGKLKNLMGSLVIKLESGVEFNLGGGYTLYDRKNPPSIGSYVTFKYYGLTKNGKPKFASFLRVRERE